MTAAATLLVIVWPGHAVPVTPYPTRALCEDSLDRLRRAGHDLMEQIPGFRAWCEPAERLTS